jgi:hypothetical protein
MLVPVESFFLMSEAPLYILHAGTRLVEREASLTRSDPPPRRTQRELGYEDLGQLGKDEPASGCHWSNGSNGIPRRARPGLAGLGPHTGVPRS